MASFCSRYSRVSAGRLLVAERSYEGSIPYARWHAVGGELRRAVDGVEGPPSLRLGLPHSTAASGHWRLLHGHTGHQVAEQMLRYLLRPDPDSPRVTSLPRFKGREIEVHP